jgi:hypothetical protein
MDHCADWESADFIASRLSAERLVATPTQWARWRGQGFLPPVRQTGLGRGAGSVIDYPAGTADRTVKIARLYRIKEKASFVGWELWWSGEDVPEIWWRPRIELAARSWQRAVRLIDRAIVKSEDDDRPDTIFDRIPASVGNQMPLNQALRSLAQSEIPSFFGVIADLALGRFEGDGAAQVEGERDSLQIMSVGLGIGRSEVDTVLGNSIGFAGALPGTLRAIARMPKLPDASRLFLGDNLHRLKAARDDTRNALAAVSAFRQSMGWIYGKNGFGLGLAGWFADKAQMALKATLALGFMQLRRTSNDLLSSDEIVELRAIAEGTLAQSLAFRQLMQTRPELRELIKPKRVKLAFSSRSNLAIYHSEIEQLRLHRV